ncbi:hypothetical protein ACFU6S_32650 [Streptomyces sp. NPDC057456]|uniref:hypothetical protein n=1 Tax=Streptomyces sp. NPDC057456 TaxID=3346139 RepID=UPI0036C3DE34
MRHGEDVTQRRTGPGGHFGGGDRPGLNDCLDYGGRVIAELDDVAGPARPRRPASEAAAPHGSHIEDHPEEVAVGKPTVDVGVKAGINRPAALITEVRGKAAGGEVSASAAGGGTPVESASPVTAMAPSCASGEDGRQVLASRNVGKVQVRANMDEILARWAAQQAAKAPAIRDEDLRELADSMGIDRGG